MAHAWKACWVNALGGSNPPSSAGRGARHRVSAGDGPFVMPRTGRSLRPVGVRRPLVEPDLVALGVDENGPPARLADLRLGPHHSPAELGHLAQRVVDRVDLDVRPRPVEVLVPRREPAAADLVRRLPHRVALVARVLLDLPAEQGAVEALRPVDVVDRDVDVRDVPVCHAQTPATGDPAPLRDRLRPGYDRPPTRGPGPGGWGLSPSCAAPPRWSAAGAPPPRAARRGTARR